MPSLEIHPLSELRDEAAALLAERFARQRAAEPLLPEAHDFTAQLPEEGLVATRAGTAVAYLGGSEATVGFGGCAATDAEALRDLFAVLAHRWQAARFTVAVPASEAEILDAFFRLAFGCQAVWAVREVEAPAAVEFAGTIRPATEGDLEALADFDQLLYDHQRDSPSFSDRIAPPRDELLVEAEETLADDSFVLRVAELDERVVGLLGLYRRPEGDLRVPPENIDLFFAATRADVRGSGAGLALTAHAFEWAREHGYRSMTVDWRAVNLLSSRFWPKRGFRPQYLRLYRAVP